MVLRSRSTPIVVGNVKAAQRLQAPNIEDLYAAHAFFQLGVLYALLLAREVVSERGQQAYAEMLLLEL